MITYEIVEKSSYNVTAIAMRKIMIYGVMSVGKSNQYYFSAVLTSRSGYNSHSVAVSNLFSKERFYLIWSEITIRLLFVSFWNSSHKRI